MKIAVVDRMEVWPLEVPLGAGRYGGSRRLAHSRTATIVKLVSSDGAVGWGEAFGPPRVLAAHLETTQARVLGARIDVTEWPLLKDLAHGYHMTSGGTVVAALSAIDIALHDLWARTLGIGVASLLGGRVRDEVAAYASTGYVTASGGIDAFEAELTAAVTEGFDAVKIKIGTGIAEDRLRTEIARKAVGPTGTVMVDYNANYPVSLAARSIEVLADLNITWFEEPLPPEDGAGYRELRRTGQTIAAGEALATRFGFRDPIAERQYDVVQPDVTACGGFTEFHAIAQLAVAWNLLVSPHCWGGGLSQAAALQALASLSDYPFGDTGPSFQILETDRAWNPLRDEMLTDPIRISEGRVAIPDGPGLGVEVDEVAIRRYLVAQPQIYVRN